VTTIERLRALLAEATPGPWQQSHFLDQRAYAHMPESWKAERRAEEALLIRPADPLGNAVAGARLDSNRALIAAAVNALPALLDVAEAARDYLAHDRDTNALAAALGRLDVAP
jgi:hypothetical protein